MRLFFATLSFFMSVTALSNPFDKFIGNYKIIGEAQLEEVGDLVDCRSGSFGIFDAEKIEVRPIKSEIDSHIIYLIGDNFRYGVPVRRNFIFKSPYSGMILSKGKTSGSEIEANYEELMFTEGGETKNVSITKDGEVFIFQLSYVVFGFAHQVDAACYRSVVIQKIN